jgi:peptidylprolyl isomerase
MGKASRNKQARRASGAARSGAYARAAARARARRRWQIGTSLGAIVVVSVGLFSFLGSGSDTSSVTTTTLQAPSVTTVPGSQQTSVLIGGTVPVKDASPAGTWGKAPTLFVPKGAAPTRIELTDLIKGSGPAIVAGQTATIQYVLATYSTRKVVASSWTSKPFSFVVGRGQVIPGLDATMAGMHQGGRRELVIPATSAYGAKSPMRGIAPHDTLVFMIDLIAIS